MSKKAAILLIEDDKDDQQLVKDLIRELEIPNQILCFDNGQKALEYLLVAEEQPFLILCDINMPVMGGIELRKHITDNEVLRKKSIPFVFLTTTASPVAVKQAYEMSVQGFFEKSLNVQDFRDLIKLTYDYWHLCKHPNS